MESCPSVFTMMLAEVAQPVLKFPLAGERAIFAAWALRGMARRRRVRIIFFIFVLFW
jgi:hypothetical protein